MLTTEVKQRINTCRDILVGKLPDPKSQVLQITNALIYKFMDDQDRIAEKLGGKASFFVKELKPYAWHKLFDSKLDNQQRADLYIEGVQKLSEAKHLPELFREIFKEAYVPFRAAGTITLFIDEINKFDYHHSEELGNAYEYLLSIMGSQGDAGQFRTPRHIIEFLVDMVDPQKGETIYDPAAGTAGFLISAYKHILEANDGKLSATERKKLSQDISGIDISPDMAKMARVNLYLHGFTTPNINEGDTLSDDDLWGKKHDVILANPPFMSPKGGIKPHDKFAIKAKRSEVLFVDYITEHLKLKGRAGIIVPEGIIFQSGTAYKDLRKMLVDDGHLFTVVSLPAGVFQPYSGVKTSILVLDRERAKETDEVLFVKIENDGYSLSSQRTEVGGSQLPEAMKVVTAWRDGKKHETPIASWVTKKEIAESGDYNLVGERYRTFDEATTDWPILKIDDVCLVNPESKEPGDLFGDNDFVYIDIESVPNGGGSPSLKNTLNAKHAPSRARRIVKNGDVLISTVRPNLKAFSILENLPQNVIASTGFAVLRCTYKIMPKYLYHQLLSYGCVSQMEGMMGKGAYPSINQTDVKKIKLPVPPIEVQQEIVAELDRYQKIIDGARQVVENYKPSFKIEPDWPVVNIGSVTEFIGGYAFKSSDLKSSQSDGDYPVIKIGNLHKEGYISSGKIQYHPMQPQLSKFVVNPGDILVAMTGATVGKVAKNESGHFLLNQRVGLFKADEKKIMQRYLEINLVTEKFYQFCQRNAGGGAQGNIPPSTLKKYEIPLPPLNEQLQIVNTLDAEYEAIQKNRILLSSFEQKIQDKIAEVWSE